jgi:MinD superfamily P-loop ATPase
MIRIAVASGKGGTGKTFVATNLFHVLSSRGCKVQLIDCDAEAPNSLAFFDTVPEGSTEVKVPIPVIDSDKCTYCGDCKDWCNFNAIFLLPDMKVIKVLEELCHSCGACSRACTHDAITEKDVVVGDISSFRSRSGASLIEARIRVGIMIPVPVIKSGIAMTDPSAEVVIHDFPPGTSCPYVHTVKSCDYVILVTEPTPYGLSNLQVSIEVLKDMGKDYGVIINRSDLGDDEMKKYLSKENIELLMEIPFSEDIARDYSTGHLHSENNECLSQQLFEMISKIKARHGNSSDQR